MLLSLLVISAGVFGILSVLGLLNGLQDKALESILEVSSYHMQLSFPESKEPEGVEEFLLNQPSVSVVVPLYEGETLVEHNSGEYSPLMVRALPEDITTIDPAFAEGVGLLEDTLPRGGVAVGISLAYQLGVSIGDTVTLLSLGGSGSLLRPAVYTPEVYEILYAENNSINNFYMLIPEADKDQIFPQGFPVTYGIKTNNYRRLGELKKTIQATYPESNLLLWSDINQDFVAALELEKNLIIILLSLLVLFTGITVRHSINRVLREKQREIAMLKALGIHRRELSAIILSMSSVVGCVGTLLGVVTAYIFLLNANTIIPWISQTMLRGAALLGVQVPLPYFYEIGYRLSLWEFLFVVLFSLSITLYSGWKGSRYIIQYSPMEVLKHE